MAEFNPDNKVETGNFLNYSRGMDSNSAWGDIFKGVGDLGVGAFKVADDAIQGGIRREVESEYDAANDAFGVTSMETIGSSTTGPKGKSPRALDEARSHITQMTKAWEHGTLKESHYFGRLSSMVKELRTRYPGYREQIDDIVADVTGINPANALRNQLLSEINAAATAEDNERKRWDTYVAQNEEYIPAALIEAYQQGLPVEHEIQREVARKKRIDQERQSDNLRLDNKAKNGEASEEDAVTSLMQDTADMFDQNASDMITNASGATTYDGVMKVINEAAQGGIDEKELPIVMAAISEYEASMLSAFEKMLTSPLSDGSPHTYASLIKDKSKIDNARKLITERTDIFRKLLADDAVGLLAINKAVTNLQDDRNLRKLYEQNDVFKLLGALGKIPGGLEMFKGAMVDGGAGLWSEAVSAFRAIEVGNAAIGENYVLQEAARKAERLGEAEGGKAMRAAVEGVVKLLIKNDTPTEVASNLANSLFSSDSKDFLTKFRKEDRIRLLTTIASPSVTQKMQEIAKVRPDLWNAYTQWAGNAFETTFGADGADLQNLIKGSGDRGQPLEYNPNTNRFEFIPVPMAGAAEGQVDIWSKSPNFDQVQQRRNNDIQKAVSELNRYMQILDPIAEANGEDKQEVAKRLMGIIGVEIKFDETDETSDVKTQEGLEGVQLSKQSVEASQLRDMIGKAEGADYNTFSGGSNQSLTGKTVAEVRDLQRNYKGVDKAVSSAAGKYQIISETMDWLINNGILDPEEPFDEEAQDRAADALLARRGYGRYLAGKMDKKKFLDNLADEWASIPNASGQSAYVEDGVNKATDGGRAIASLFQ